MQKINQFNQYLLEKYPTIWNTRIVWMLLGSLAVHILFFVIGYLSHIDPVSLQKYSVKNDYYTDGVIFIHLIISILMIVGWLLMMFKNNAFKNFYPSSKGKLFVQFVQYFIIIFASTTFFFSYMVGFRLFINQKYSDEEMSKNIDIINRVHPFLSQNLESYTLENRLFPKPFNDLYCETDIDDIDRNKKYFVYYDRVYQFNSVYSKTSFKRDKKNEFIIPEPEASLKTPIAYSDTKEKSQIFYFKKEVVDVSPYIKTTGLTYYNFSNILYDHNFQDYDDGASAIEIDYYYNKDSPDHTLKNKKAIVNQKTAELLDRKNPAELEKLLTDFLAISKKYRVKNNLEAKSWVKMIYTPQNPDFEVRYFIKDYQPRINEDDEYYDSDIVVDSVSNAIDEYGNIVTDSVKIRQFNPEINNQVSPQDYFKNNVTDYYYCTDHMKELLENVDRVKNEDFFSENVHIYIWIAFFLSTFIFSFRITGLKSLLFSVISAGLLVLAITLVIVMYTAVTGLKEEFFVLYFLLLVSLVILLIPIFKIESLSKVVSSIFVNISMNGFVLFLLLIFGIINMHQKAMCGVEIYDSYDISQTKTCVTVFDYLGLGISYILLLGGFIFMYFYTSVLQRWKAMPE
ncbi:hypothetical protein [Chryseobacterium binzhouense]|uniref:hypothetical protein n=1 Tax=Chryseobacterium binzhouense TaxID=2593646 RepID=UPI00289C6C15|nr:hypothetical protein [Chryseobacterium binzhouense]